MTSIKAKMSKDKADFDGLSTDEAVASMLAHPERPLTVVATLDVVAIDHNVLTGVKTPKVAMRAVEIMPEELVQQAIGLQEKVFAQRTGRAAPPAGLWDAQAGMDDPAAEAPDPDDATPAKGRTRRAKSEE